MTSSGDRPMNFSNLVERMVPLMAELFATLKANDPLRMDFADIAHKTLLDIVEVLRDEGVTQEVIAESLGLTISGFYKKVRELREVYEDTSGSRRAAPSLIEAVYAWVSENATTIEPISHAAIRTRFKATPKERLNAVLRYLVQFNLLSASGHGERRQFRIVPRQVSSEATYHDLMVMLYREGPLTLDQMATTLELLPSMCDAHLETMREAGCLEETIAPDGTRRFRATRYHVPVDTPDGFEAALFDHFSAVSRAMCQKVRLARYSASSHERIGGATYAFDVPVDSPEYAEISAFLSETRGRLEGWLEAVQKYEVRGPEEQRARITCYAGQMIEGEE